VSRSLRLRPEFEITLRGPGEALLANMRDRLDAPDCALTGQVRKGHAFLGIPDGRRGLLSPHLNLECVDGDDCKVVRGRFSPSPNVWTGFMALFFFIGMLGLAGLIYGLAQMTVDGPLWPMLAAPAAIALNAFIYGAAFIGQGLTSHEMFELRAFVEFAVRETAKD